MQTKRVIYVTRWLERKPTTQYKKLCAGILEKKWEGTGTEMRLLAHGEGYEDEYIQTLRKEGVRVLNVGPISDGKLSAAMHVAFKESYAKYPYIGVLDDDVNISDPVQFTEGCEMCEQLDSGQYGPIIQYLFWQRFTSRPSDEYPVLAGNVVALRKRDFGTVGCQMYSSVFLQNTLEIWDKYLPGMGWMQDVCLSALALDAGYPRYQFLATKYSHAVSVGTADKPDMRWYERRITQIHNGLKIVDELCEKGFIKPETSNALRVHVTNGYNIALKLISEQNPTLLSIIPKSFTEAVAFCELV